MFISVIHCCIIIQCPLSLGTIFVVSILSDISIDTLALLYTLCMEYLFLCFYFQSMCVFKSKVSPLAYSWTMLFVSILPAFAFKLEFNLFIFNVIIDKQNLSHFAICFLYVFFVSQSLHYYPLLY